MKEGDYKNVGNEIEGINVMIVELEKNIYGRREMNQKREKSATLREKEESVVRRKKS